MRDFLFRKVNSNTLVANWSLDADERWLVQTFDNLLMK